MADKHTARKHWRCTLERVEKFISPLYFSDVNLFSRLYPKKAPVTSITHFAAPGRVSYHDAMKGTFLPVKVGDNFGPTWSTHWFQVQVDIPEEWCGEEIHLRWNSNSEAMVWQDGQPMQGLTGSDGHQRRTDFVLSTRAVPSERFTIYIEMAANGMFGAGKDGLINAPDPERRYSLSMAEIAVFNNKCYEILQDLTVILDLAKHLPEGSPRAYDALYTANEIVNVCDVTDEESFARCHEIARRFLSQGNGDSQHTVHAIGNCHIDSAWLWPVAETVRKCGRSFSTAVRLMEKYPEFKFVCSQMQQLAWVKESYPALYQEIRGRVTTGQFIPVGGTWIEMDGNIPSGESFIRQFLVGQKFVEAEFGHTCDEFWLPDTFGYSAQLPQIMNGAGIKYFLTQKLSWSLVNTFPFHTFYWEGIDGSRCLAHFPPADTYESRGNVEDVLKTVSNLKDKGRVRDSILLYGHGDGGGGPAEEMLEMLKRMKDVDGCPRVRFSTPQEFFQAVDTKSSKELCTWVGELYLELHQGSFTTQAEIKRRNRQGEFLMHNAELVCALDWALGGKSPEQYPSGELLRIWKLLLLNQFHDILPGTSIREAVQDALNDYNDIHSSAKVLFQDGFNKLTSNLNPNARKTSKPVVVNTLCWERVEIVVVPKKLWETLSKQEQSSLRSQILTDGDVLVQVMVPSMGIAPLNRAENVANQNVSLSTDGDSTVLENSLLRLELDCAGRIVSLIHKESKKNAVSPGRLGNEFVLFDDIPLFWDAWDIMPYYLEKRKIISEPLRPSGTLQIIESGPLVVAVESSLKISEQSFIRQVISLEADCPFVKFHTKVEWHENRKLLKVEFPVDVHTMNATYEIQCGHLQRPTHCNTSWDWAKFEVCGHKWADVSEHDWGVSLMTDSKYGYSTHGSEMFISLLRSPKAPDDQADMGQHEFAYAIFPHSGTFQSAGLVQHAYNFNESVRVMCAEVTEDFASTSFFSVDNPGVVLETVKKAEEVPSALVVRLYEAFGGRSCCKLSSPLKITAVKSCNLLEVPAKGIELSWTSGGVELTLRPFQIVSLLLYLK